MPIWAVRWDFRLRGENVEGKGAFFGLGLCMYVSRQATKERLEDWMRGRDTG